MGPKWPHDQWYSPGRSRPIRNSQRNPIAAPASRVRDVTNEDQLVEEALDLARIRETKSRRFKHALGSVFVFYAWTVVTFLLLRNC